ncbi:hypothetical protein MsAg5_13100 [Methanosarcinaceae archaeon Ag5]|uniref:Uncharacterized protein n=1 Tax=Methanolapillus africanus TaxID=3028297 RepID=A0AAE4MIZ0_9EURY|nr:hypothetical protein [Methanosarcinaceae archaeon Ag5]
MNTKVIFIMVLFAAVGIISVFSLVMFSAIDDDANASISPDLQTEYDITTKTISTSISLMSFIPYILMLAAFVAAFSIIFFAMRRR